jgi:hypothetical protein
MRTVHVRYDNLKGCVLLRVAAGPRPHYHLAELQRRGPSSQGLHLQLGGTPRALGAACVKQHLKTVVQQVEGALATPRHLEMRRSQDQCNNYVLFGQLLHPLGHASTKKVYLDGTGISSKRRGDWMPLAALCMHFIFLTNLSFRTPVRPLQHFAPGMGKGCIAAHAVAA